MVATILDLLRNVKAMGQLVVFIEHDSRGTASGELEDLAPVAGRGGNRCCRRAVSAARESLTAPAAMHILGISRQ